MSCSCLQPARARLPIQTGHVGQWSAGAPYEITLSSGEAREESKGQSPRGTGHVALALSGGRVCVCLSLWLLLSVGSQGRNPNPAGTLIPCLTLGPVWVTGWLYGDGAGHVRAPPP